jgi:nicotinate-nucleotide--dimethylbenzimidazole phosphoribosyltransferase
MTSLPKLLDLISVPDAAMEAAARRHLDQLTKPPGSLGRLEELAAKLTALRGQPPRIERPHVFVFAADHGVVAEGVTAYPQIVTAQMVENFLRGGAAINVLARQAEAAVTVADFGVIGPVQVAGGLVSCRLGVGTANMAQGPAMSRAQATAGIQTGVRLAENAIADGADLLVTGEMGIGNTTAASAITAAITGAEPEGVTGRGTGVDEFGWARKVAAIRQALCVSAPDSADGLDVLAKVGGFEIAGLVGVILAGAAHRVPVALDGFIAGAAALVAVALAPAARHACFAAHRSAEPGHGRVLAHLGLEPYLDLGLRLGEGTGATLFIHLARAAARIYAEMATFKSAGICTSEGASTAPSEASPPERMAPAKPALERKT